MNISKPALLAIATAVTFSAAIAVAEDASQTQTIAQSNATAAVRCYGINSCKGKGACQTSSNACNGKNACKSMGVLMVNSQQECITKGGSLTEVPPPVQSPTTPASQAMLPPAAPYSGQ